MDPITVPDVDLMPDHWLLFGLSAGAALILATILFFYRKGHLSPPWKHPDVLVRQQAVAHIDELRLLAEIATRDKDPRVRVAAVDKLVERAFAIAHQAKAE